MKIRKLFHPSVRGRTFAFLTVAILIAVVALNFALSLLPQKGRFLIDMTPEGLYTLTDRMVEECAFLDDDEKLGEDDVEIIFCADPDALISSTVTRVVYFMARKLESKYDRLKVRCENIAINPTAVAKYKTTSLSEIRPTDVIISHGNTYRISPAEKFWTISNNTYWSYNGEYRLASLLKSLLGTQSKAYFVTGHGETVYQKDNATLSSFHDLLVECGLSVDMLSLSSVERIPDDCALLIINNPTSDYTDGVDLDSFYAVSEIEKIDRYLVDKQGAMMVCKDYRVSLPTLEYYLREWGISFGNALVVDESEHLENGEGTQSTLVSQYDTDTNGYGYAIYGDFVANETAPEVIVKDSGFVECFFDESDSVNEDGAFGISRNYASFLSTSADGRAFGKDAIGDVLVRDYGVLDTSCVSVRMTTDTYSSEKQYSYVFASASASFLDNEMLSNTAWANYEVVSALVRNISRVDEHASMDLGGTSLNSSKFGGKQLLDTTIVTERTQVYNSDKEVVEVNEAISEGMKIFIYIFIALIPVAVVVCGVVISIRRRYL